MGWSAVGCLERKRCLEYRVGGGRVVVGRFSNMLGIGRRVQKNRCRLYIIIIVIDFTSMDRNHSLLRDFRGVAPVDMPQGGGEW